MPRGIKIGITVVASVAVLPIVVIIVLFVGMSRFTQSQRFVGKYGWRIRPV